MTTYLPRGSVLNIEAKDLLAPTEGTTKIWNKITEHNRSDISISIERIEKIVRTSNGTLRKNHIADKRKFSMSWTMLPSYRTLTVDAGWGAEDLRSFYLSDDGKKEFNIRINLAKDGTDRSSTGAAYTPTMAKTSSELYTVVFGGCNFSVVKRGLQPHWNVSIELEEV
jgi:hypothetical protein